MEGAPLSAAEMRSFAEFTLSVRSEILRFAQNDKRRAQNEKLRSAAALRPILIR